MASAPCLSRTVSVTGHGVHLRAELRPLVAQPAAPPSGTSRNLGILKALFFREKEQTESASAVAVAESARLSRFIASSQNITRDRFFFIVEGLRAVVESKVLRLLKSFDFI